MVRKSGRTRGKPRLITSLAPMRAPKELTDSHGQAFRKVNSATGEEKQESHQIAGEVHYLRMGGGPGQALPEAEHEDHGPEGSGARPEEPVIEAEPHAATEVKRSLLKSGADILKTETGRDEQVAGNRQEKIGNYPAEKAGVETLDHHRAEPGTDGGPNDAHGRLTQTHRTGSDKVEHRAAGPEGGLEVCSSREPREEAAQPPEELVE